MIAAAFVLQAAAAEVPVSMTVYVGSHFEVRDHDQPTKYVFNGATRVAAVTGSLSANTQIQRVRLHPGWNLLSLAVTANNVLGQFNPGESGQSEAVSAAYQWNPATRDYSPVPTGQTVTAGAVLWIKANANAVVGITGSYTEPTSRHAEPGGTYVAGAGLEAWSPNLPPTISAWTYDATTKLWHNELTGELTVLADPPPTLSPGDVLFVRADTAADLEIPDPTLRIRYYHEDHLGSASVITDANGALVEETAFHPYGQPRNEYLFRQVEEPYGFTQKERDRESGLNYFGKRFYAPTIGKWLSTDPLEEKGGSLNLYGYANENPLKYLDPDGGEVKIAFDKASSTYTINVKAVLVNYSTANNGRTFSGQQIQEYADKLKATIVSSFSGHEGQIKWKTAVDLKVIDSSVTPDKNDHVFRIVDHTKTGSAGAAYIGGKVMDIEAATLWAKLPSEMTQEERDNPSNKGYAESYQSPETVGAHELGHNLGLPHVSQNTLMHGGVRDYDAATVSRQEIEKIYRQYKAGNLNQDDAVLAGKGKSAD